MPTRSRQRGRPVPARAGSRSTTWPVGRWRSRQPRGGAPPRGQWCRQVDPDRVVVAQRLLGHLQRLLGLGHPCPHGHPDPCGAFSWARALARVGHHLRHTGSVWRRGGRTGPDGPVWSPAPGGRGAPDGPRHPRSAPLLGGRLLLLDHPEVCRVGAADDAHPARTQLGDLVDVLEQLGRSWLTTMRTPETPPRRR